MKCVLPVAGFGTRFLPFTKVIPKELIPIGAKPLIQFAVQESFDSGINNFVIILNKEKLSIKQFFKRNSNIENLISETNKNHLLDSLNSLIDKSNFKYVYQEQMHGLGHAILQAKDEVNNSSFAVILPDDLCFNNDDPVLSQLVRVQKDYPDCCVVALEEVSDSAISNYGVPSIENIEGHDNERLFRVLDLIEKPKIEDAPSKYAVIGRYILTQEIFNFIEEASPGLNNEIQLTDALSELAKKGKVIGYIFEGKRYDCGQPKGWKEAIIDL